MRIMLIDDEITIEDATGEDMVNFAMNLIHDTVAFCHDDNERKIYMQAILKAVPKVLSQAYMDSKKLEKGGE